ncbi:MAG: aldo/keto reductase, partial [Rhodomicrobium sp.]
MMAAAANARSARVRNVVTRRGVELQFTELGFGGAPLGNLYRPMTEKEARLMLETVWASGCRYFDTAPLYGLGLSETRLNGFLRPKPRESFLISTKVVR